MVNKIFTTAVDKNGKKIYVGDKVRCNYHNGLYDDTVVGEVVIHDFCFKIHPIGEEEYINIRLRDLHNAEEKKYIPNYGEIVTKWVNDIEVLEDEEDDK